MFLASSSEVYNKPSKIPTDENETLRIPDIKNPRYSYGGGKIFSELYGINFAKKYLKKFIIFSCIMSMEKIWAMIMSYQNLLIE